MQQNRESRQSHIFMGLLNMRRVVFQVIGEKMAYRINNSGQHVTLCQKKKKKVSSLAHTIYEHKFQMD